MRDDITECAFQFYFFMYFDDFFDSIDWIVDWGWTEKLIELNSVKERCSFQVDYRWRRQSQGLVCVCIHSDLKY